MIPLEELDEVLQVVVLGREAGLLVVVAQVEQDSLVRIGLELKAGQEAIQPRHQTTQDPSR